MKQLTQKTGPPAQNHVQTNRQPFFKSSADGDFFSKSAEPTTDTLESEADNPADTITAQQNNEGASTSADKSAFTPQPSLAVAASGQTQSNPNESTEELQNTDEDLTKEVDSDSQKKAEGSLEANSPADASASEGVLDQSQMAPIDAPPAQSQLKQAEQKAEQNRQAAQPKPDVGQNIQGPKPGRGGSKNKEQKKAVSGKGRQKSKKKSKAAAGIKINSPLPRIATARSAGANTLLTRINNSYAQLEQQFLERYAQKQESLATSVALQQQELSATGDNIKQRITAAIAAARATVINNVAASQGQITGHRMGQDGSLTGAQNASMTEVSTIFSTGQTDVTDSANNYADRSVQAANDAATQLRTNVSDSVDEANNKGEQKANSSSGNSEVRSAKQRASREIAADSAQKIAGGQQDGQQKLRETGPMAATEFRNQGSEAASQLILGKSEVDGELTNIYSNAKVGIGSIEEMSNQSLGQTQEQLLGQLAELEASMLAKLHEEIDKKIADLDTAGEQMMGLFDEQAQQALSNSRTQLEANNNEIAGSRISEDRVEEAHSMALNEINGGFDSLGTSLDNSAQLGTDQLVQQNSQLKSLLGNTQAVILSQIGDFSTNAQSQIDQSRSSTITQISDTSTQAVSGAGQVVGQVGTNITQQVQTVDQNFSSGFVDLEGNLGQRVDEGTTEARTPLGDLDSRIDQGQARAATRAERSWLSNQWHDAVEMLSSPGFWAGLIVGLILTIVFLLLIAGTALTGGALLAVLVIGFAVIGGIAAAVGSVVNQATNGSFSGGWDMSRVDWGQVGRAALFGAAAGAVFAVVAFFAVEVFGVAVASWGFVAIMSVTAGVVTIVTNLINGQPWDKDLLINMTIAGFFAWLARFFPGGRGRPTEEVPPDTPEPIPPRPGETDGPDPLPPDVDVPTPIRPGQDIIIRDPSRLTYTEPYVEGGYVKWNLVDPDTGAIFTHYVKATSSTGPDMFLDPQNSLIPGVGRVTLVAEGFKWTPVANELNMRAYEAHFGGRPPNLNGQIWASNLDRFVINYDAVRTQNPGASPQAIADSAIRTTSFGRGKIDQGYGNLRVVMDGVEFGNVTIKGRTYNNVPRNDVAIDVIAEPTTP